MKKHFLFFSMLLMGLFTVTTVQARLTPEEAETKGYWARLTAHQATSTNGTGKVYVDTAYVLDPTTIDYQPTHHADAYTDAFFMTDLLRGAEFKGLYARADNGSCFVGWSFTDGNTDLGAEQPTSKDLTPSSEKGHGNIRKYDIYAAFKKICLDSYTVSGSQKTAKKDEKWVSTQTVVCVAKAEAGLDAGDEVRHFELPVVTKKDGTLGTWSVDVTAWVPGTNINITAGSARLTVKVKFTAPDDAAREYSAILTMATKAGVKLEIPLYARTIGTNDKDISLYDGKTFKKAINFSELDSDSDFPTYANPIVKLNKDYGTAPLTLNGTYALDLNGYTIRQNAVPTITGGNITIAYSPFGGTINKKVYVNAGKLTLNGGTLGSGLEVKSGAELVQNGATINGEDAVTNAGTFTMNDGAIKKGITSSGTLTVNGGSITSSGTAITVTEGEANINRGAISGATYGVEATGGIVTIEKQAAISGGKALHGAGGAITVKNGKFEDPNALKDGTIDFQSGYFKTNESGATDVLGKSIFRNTAGTEYREGYTLFAGTQETAQASGVSVCRIGQTSYTKLEDALDYANNNPNQPLIIFMENDYSLKAGYYTIPAKATLVVPMSDKQDEAFLTVPRETATSSDLNIHEFRKLTFESGVQMNILGALEVSCAQYCKPGAAEQAIPGGPYGHLILKPGSHITLSAGAELRAWGYITGDGTKDANDNYLSGEIDARRGSVVREQFQIGDWKGGDASYTLIREENNKYGLFPIYEYFIQNIESPVKYHPGSSLKCATAVEVSGGIRAFANDIEMVGVQGDPAMFLMDQKADAENTWVRKWYDASKDQQVYEINSGAQLGFIVIDLGSLPWSEFSSTLLGNFDVKIDSRKFVLPLTSNFKIHLLSGQMEFTQSTACLPGMEVEIDKESTISIVKNEHPDKVVSGALYLYDADQWGDYVHNKRFGSIVHYSATLKKQPTYRKNGDDIKVEDAKLIVHGTFQMAEGCAVFTSAEKTETSNGGNSYTCTADVNSGGASIISTNADAGTFIFGADAVASKPFKITKEGEKLTGITFNDKGKLDLNVLMHYDNHAATALTVEDALSVGQQINIYNFQLFTSARLKNTDGSFINTYTDADHYAKEGDAYCFIDDRWRILKVDSTNECFLVDTVNNVYYAKPQEYVAITATKVTKNEGTSEEYGILVGNADHTFSDAAGAGRLFILLNDGSCQWWEVENKDNLYHCIHPQNDTYYYWDESDEMWKEKRFVISWLNYNGDTLVTADENGNPTKSYSVTYGTQAEYLGTTPSRPASIDYTYDFKGWTPQLAPVTKDVTYTAVYTEKPRKYTVVFQHEGGMEIERHLLGHNEVPVCENVPTRAGFTLQWSPAIAAVTGDAVYTATWLEEPPTEYEITFVDYDGDVVNHTIWKGNVAVGTTPVAPAIVDGKPEGAAGKPATSEFSYVFDHWSPNVTEVTQAMTYTAVYREEAILYTVIFKNEDGSEIEQHQYAYGETPVCSGTPTKPTEEGYTYTLMWNPQIQTVMGPETYTADYQTLKTKNKYSVKAKCSPAAAAIMTGNGVYEHNATATLGFTAATGFYFEKWSDEVTTPTRTMPVTSNIELTAVFTNEAPVNYTITWKNEDGSETLQTVTQPAGPTSYTGDTPTKPATSSATYEFDGWTTEPNGAGTPYKNGMTPDATADATYYAHFFESPISNDLIVEGDVTLGTPLTYENLIIKSDCSVFGHETSGQLLDPENLTLTGDAYFELTLNAKARTWYAAAVPWRVDAGTGISANGTPLALGVDVDVVSYNGARRAQLGKYQKNWHYLENGEIMEPGIQYIIAFRNPTSVVRFAKKHGEVWWNTKASVYEYDSQTKDPSDRGWNAIANPAIYYAYINPGVTAGQVFVPTEDGVGRYEPITNLASEHFVVGQGVFVQVDDTKENFDVNHNSFAAAPRRRMNALDADNINANYEVRIAPINKPYTDRMFIYMNNEKEQDVYTIDKDLSKIDVCPIVAQMWVNRYDSKLCINTMTPVDGNAEYPLGIFAPKAGEYTIGMKFGETTDTQSDLYLTLDGQAIWNLSRNAYVIELEQGTTERYGLRISAKAPQSTQAIDEIIVNSKDDTATKVLINDQVFIIRGGEVYTVTGNKVK